MAPARAGAGSSTTPLRRATRASRTEGAGKAPYLPRRTPPPPPPYPTSCLLLRTYKHTCESTQFSNSPRRGQLSLNKEDGGLRVRAGAEPPVRAGAGEHPGPGDPRHEPPERGLPLAGGARPHQDPPRGRQADLQDHHRHPLPLPHHRDGGVGERADEHAVAGGPHRVVPDRAVQPAVDRPAAAPQLQGGRGGERLGPGRRPRRARLQAPRRPFPHHQGHLHRPQRDRHRRHQRSLRRPQAPRQAQAPGAAAGGRGVVDMRGGLPHGRVGRGRGADGVAEGAVAADGAGHRVREPQGAGGEQDGEVGARLLRLGRLPQVLQDGHLLALHPLHPAPLRPPRRPRPHLRGGPRQRHQEAHPPRHRHQAGRRGVGAQELHAEGGVVQRHRHRRRRAVLHRQLRDREARVEAVQPQPRPRPQQGRRQGLQDWPPRPPQRAAIAGLPERSRDGAQGRRLPGEARQRRGGGGGLPVEFDASHPVQDLSAAAPAGRPSCPSPARRTNRLSSHGSERNRCSKSIAYTWSLYVKLIFIRSIDQLRSIIL